MNETIVLARYAWTKQRLVCKLLIGLMMLCAFGYGIAFLLPGMGQARNILAGLGVLSIGTSLIFSVVLFEFGGNTNMLDSRSNYDPFLLRMPIATWKLATIPVLLVTAWIAIGVTVLGLLFIVAGVQSVQIIAQILACSSCAIFILSLIWKPQRGSWQRLAKLCLSAPVLYTLVLGGLIVESETALHKLRWVVLPVSAFAYVAAVGLALHSVRQARVAAYQQITPGVLAKATSVRSMRPVRVFKDRFDALRWHDWQRGRATRYRLVGMMFLMVLTTSFVIPLTVNTLIVLLAMVGMLTCTGASTVIEEAVWGNRSSLPSYLAVSPLSTMELASRRLRGILRMFSSLFLLGAPCVLLGLVWAENRAALAQWWLSTSDSLFSVQPLKQVVVVVASVYVTSLGLSLRISCVQMLGRQAVNLALGVGLPILALSLLSVMLSEFIHLRQWEQWQVMWTHWQSRFEYWTYVALVAKATWATVLIVSVSRRWPQLMAKWCAVLSVWCGSVLGLGTLLWALQPGLDLQVLQAIRYTALAIPLSPWFAAPLAVQSNRHRAISGIKHLAVPA